MSTVMITGGTGMIGKALCKALLEKGYEVIILSRKKQDESANLSDTEPGISYANWNIQQETIDAGAISKTDFIIHLAGAGIANKRWTAKRKKEIVDSRVKTGELLVKALQKYPNDVKAIVSASAIGWYGADPSVPNLSPFTEEFPAADNFLADTVKQWEASLVPVKNLGKRLVQLRTGIVLSRKGGALSRFRQPLLFGFATILGNGKQVLSWIHLDDLVRLYILAIENVKLEGVYNAVAPAPVSNKEFVLQLAKVKKGRFFIPVYVPSFILKLVLGEMSIEVLKSTTVSCGKIKATGFTFLFPSVDAALYDLERRNDNYQ